MAVFYVFQGETYQEERSGGYVWSPKFAKGNKKNAGYTKMTFVKKSDFILHNSNGKIMAISITKTDCYDSAQPKELIEADTSVQWNNDGYRIDTRYYDFDIPVLTSDFKEWLKAHPQKDSAFTTEGKGKQQYMCSLADEHAIYLIEQAIKVQHNESVISMLQAALSDIINDRESEYSPIEVDSINTELDSKAPDKKPEWTGERKPQDTVISEKTNREIPKRDPLRAVQALQHADYLCEFNQNDRTFLRKNGTPYTEPHHLIPISKYRDFEYSVDVMENIVSLCSHCHNLLHYGKFEDKEPVLRKLYDERKEALKKCGIDLTWDKLKAYYQ